MSFKQIKELRQAGQLTDALELAQNELNAQPDNIWNKRAIAWVFYDFVKQHENPAQYDQFLHWLQELEKLDLPEDEKMIFDNLSWQIGKMVFAMVKDENPDTGKIWKIFQTIKSFHFTKPSEAYSFIYSAFHKALKENFHFIEFANWWNFDNFLPENYEKEKLQNGNEIMAMVEQAYIAYSKHLLPQNIQGHYEFNREKATEFLPKLTNVVDNYPKFQYPAYFKAKLLLALGDKDNLLGALLPFARKKRNDFWVWDILSEAFSHNKEKVIACYCKALSCYSPPEMLVGVRQKLAGLFVEKSMYNEAKTEIVQILEIKKANGHKIPNTVNNWQNSSWYSNAVDLNNNSAFYRNYLSEADEILFHDTLQTLVFVEFVNRDRSILNFIDGEFRTGFFKYDRFLKEVRTGDVLKVRFQQGNDNGRYQVFTAFKHTDNNFKNNFLKEVEGTVKIKEGANFGFVNDIYMHPTLVVKYKLSNGMNFKGQAVKSFNKEKKEWGWKIL